MKRKSTKDVIADTVFDLLQTHKIESLTIAQITEDADISARTFYNHFKDKYDVCNYIYVRMLEQDCWYENGKRVNLDTFFKNQVKIFSGPFLNYFINTVDYMGQNNIHSLIVEIGTRDLIDQLIYTGHKELVTPETIDLIEFYMHGLDSFFAIGLNDKTKRNRLQNLNKTATFLPKDLHEALTAEPIYAPEKPKKKNK